MVNFHDDCIINFLKQMCLWFNVIFLVLLYDANRRCIKKIYAKFWRNSKVDFNFHPVFIKHWLCTAAQKRNVCVLSEKANITFWSYTVWLILSHPEQKLNYIYWDSSKVCMDSPCLFSLMMRGNESPRKEEQKCVSELLDYLSFFAISLLD